MLLLIGLCVNCVVMIVDVWCVFVMIVGVVFEVFVGM